MSDSRTSKWGVTAGILLGGAVGAAAAFLLTPKRGEEVRKNIVEKKENFKTDAQIATSNFIKRAEGLVDLAKKYANNLYEYPVERVEAEIKKLRSAFDAAVDSYKKYGKIEKREMELVSEDISAGWDDDRLPKHEGMGREKSRHTHE